MMKLIMDDGSEFEFESIKTVELKDDTVVVFQASTMSISREQFAYLSEKLRETFNPAKIVILDGSLRIVSVDNKSE